LAVIDDVWSSLVSAERNVAELRAEINSSANKATVLEASLAVEAGVWEQRAALGFLHSFASEIPNHVPRLFQLALGERWGGEARELLARGRRPRIVLAVVQCVMESVPLTEAEDYLHVAALLSRLEVGDTLRLIAADAARSDDPEVREAGEFIRERHGRLISCCDLE
jgi:hypothetical protein